MNKKIDIKLGIAVIAIFTITLAVFIWKQNEGNGRNEVIVQPEPIINNSEQMQWDNKTPEEIGKNYDNISTSSWKLYADKKYGYSVSYPSDWASNFIDGASFYVKELKKTGERYPDFGNILSDNSENLKSISGDYFVNISVYRQKGLQVSLKEWRKYDGGDYKELLLKGNPALKFEKKPYKNQANKDIAGSLRYYFFDKENNGYEVTVWYKNDSNGIGERILSTLLF